MKDQPKEILNFLKHHEVLDLQNALFVRKDRKLKIRKTYRWSWQPWWTTDLQKESRLRICCNAVITFKLY